MVHIKGGHHKWMININRIMLYVLIVIICITFPYKIYAETANSTDQEIDMENHTELQDSLLQSLDTNEINQYWTTIQNEYGRFLPNYQEKNLLQLMKSNDSISFKSIVKGLISYLFYELIENGKLLSKLLLITLFASILHMMYTAFNNRVIYNVANIIIYIVLISILINSFNQVYHYLKSTIDMMSHFLLALLPLLFSLMATFGQVMTIAFFHPFIIFLIHTSGLLISNIIFPLLYLSAILHIVSQINDKFQATQLASLLKTISMGILAIYLTVFLAVVSVQGATVAIQDGVALKTTKFITGNFIPVVGKTFTEAEDTVLSSTLLLKNTVGVVGVIIICFIAIFPAIKVMVIAFIYKLAAALLQPLGNHQIIVSLQTVSTYIIYMLACLITVTFMFFLVIVLLSMVSNLPLLMR